VRCHFVKFSVASPERGTLASSATRRIDTLILLENVCVSLTIIFTKHRSLGHARDSRLFNSS
jgi:hypothetical protein